MSRVRCKAAITAALLLLLVPIPSFANLGALVFDEEFNQSTGSMPNTSIWTYDTGTDPNNSAVHYVDDASTLNIVDDASATDGKSLAMTLTPAGSTFNSARITTLHDPIGGQLQYGHIEARIRLPGANGGQQGVWPAFWMLGSDFPAVGWPQCGETDIMEFNGSKPSIVQGSLHAGSTSGVTNYDPTGYDTLANNQDFWSAYHTFAIDWTPAAISFSVDGSTYETQQLANVPASDAAPFDKPFYLILNVAAGGSYAGPATPTSPQTMYVDYVRAYSAAPEPGSASLILCGLSASLLHRRRRTAQVQNA